MKLEGWKLGAIVIFLGAGIIFICSRIVTYAYTYPEVEDRPDILDKISVIIFCIIILSAIGWGIWYKFSGPKKYHPAAQAGGGRFKRKFR